VPPASNYYWSVQAIDAGWLGGPFAPEQTVSGTVAVDSELSRSIGFAVESGNPVVGDVGFRIELPTATQAKLTIWDVAGRVVASVLDGWLSEGVHSLNWRSDRPRPSGIYLAALQVDGRTLVRRIVSLR
jgi:hypothetical protein